MDTCYQYAKRHLTLMLVILSTSFIFPRVANSNTQSDYNVIYPKASEDANVLYQLRSNKERTHFFIDDKEVGIGKKLMVQINNQGHTIVAQPENCETSKEEFVQPPYNHETPLSFTFVQGDCEQPLLVADKDNSNENKPTINFYGNVGKIVGNIGSSGDFGNNTDNSNESSQIKREEISQKKSPLIKEMNSQNKSKVRNDNEQIALDKIRSFVLEICKSAEDSGHSDNINLKGNTEAKLSNLIKNLADIGIKGAAEYQSQNYQGVLQKDLPALLSKDSDCKINLSSMLIEKFIKK